MFTYLAVTWGAVGKPEVIREPFSASLAVQKRRCGKLPPHGACRVNECNRLISSIDNTYSTQANVGNYAFDKPKVKIAE